MISSTLAFMPESFEMISSCSRFPSAILASSNFSHALLTAVTSWDFSSSSSTGVCRRVMTSGNRAMSQALISSEMPVRVVISFRISAYFAASASERTGSLLLSA